MEKIIACCGLNCAGCDARIATITNDEALRSKTAELWKTQHNIADITSAMINCTGCREEGAKIGHCSECAIRNCAISKNFKTCAECDMLDTCETIAAVHKFAADAMNNLKSLN